MARHDASFNAEDIVRLTGPLVYLIRADNKVIYVGRSDHGAARALDKNHTHAMALRGASGLQLFFCETERTARQLETSMIAKWQPSLNKYPGNRNEPIVTKMLGKELRRKRGDMSLREAQVVSGIHYATLHRMERGYQGGSWRTLQAALNWLEVPAWKWGEYLAEKKNGRRSA